MQDWGVAFGFFIGAVILLALIAAPVLYFVRRTKTHRDIVAAEREFDRVYAEYARAGMVKGSVWSGNSAAGTYGGVAFTAKLVVEGKVARSILVADSALRGEFAVRREAGSDDFFKSVGFAEEAQTGDPAFDSEVYLLGRSRAYLEALFAEPRNRAAVRSLLALGFDYLEFRDGKLEASKRPHAAMPALSVVRSAIEALATLREPPAAVPLAAASARGVSTKAIQEASGLAILAALAAWAALVYRLGLDDANGALLAALVEYWRWLVPAFVIAVALAALALRGRAAAVQELTQVALGLAFCIVAGLAVRLHLSF